MIRYRTTWGIPCHFVMYFMIIMSSCKEQASKAENYSNYYVQVDKLPSGGKKYIYRNIADTTLSEEIWEYKRLGEGRLLSINYDHQGQIVQKQYERIVGNGVLIDSLLLFFHDSLGSTISFPVRVLSPHRLPFTATDSSKVFLTHLEWWQPGDSLHIELQRRRRFIGETLWKNNDGKSIPAIHFRSEDTFETERDGWSNSTWYGEEIYAKDIGLVYYKRDISSQMKLEYRLEKIIDLK